MKIDEKRLYENIVGHIPPEISERIKVGMQTDPKLTQMFEDLRIHVMEPEALDAKTVQLLLFGMMAAKLVSAPTRYHAVAAKKAGASMDELYAVAGLALLAGGMRSYNEAGELRITVCDEATGAVVARSRPPGGTTLGA